MPPKGPLEVKDVYEDNCILEWQPPDDDGGEPIEAYEVEKMDSSTGRWVPAGRSKDTKFHVRFLYIKEYANLLYLCIFRLMVSRRVKTTSFV